MDHTGGIGAANSPARSGRHHDKRPLLDREFEQAAEAHLAWVRHYFEHARDYPVLARVVPGQIRAALPAAAPEEGEALADILSDFETKLLPGITHWNHPRFFAWFAISSTPPAVLAELLAATLNNNAMLWKSSPAATELEQVTLDWLRQWLSLPPQFGIIYDTSSMGVLQALAAAREQADPAVRERGMQPGLTVYLSEQTHSSAEKAALMLGFGRDHIRKIGTDASFRMRTDLLRGALAADTAAGKRPCAVVATVGTTSTASIDPVREIGELKKKFPFWLHVDAAYGGAAAVLPEMRGVLDGAEQADSVGVNPHKWLFVPVDLSVLFTRRPEILRRASSLTAEYLRTATDDTAVNFMDYGLQLGRRFRALKLWYVMRYYGRRRIAAMIAEHVRLARQLAGWIEADPAFEIAAPVNLALVCFRMRAANDLNAQLLEEVNASGAALLSHTVLGDQYVLRLAVGNFMTTEDDVRQTWNLIQATGARLREAGRLVSMR